MASSALFIYTWVFMVSSSLSHFTFLVDRQSSLANDTLVYSFVLIITVIGLTCNFSLLGDDVDTAISWRFDRLSWLLIDLFCFRLMTSLSVGLNYDSSTSWLVKSLIIFLVYNYALTIRLTQAGSPWQHQARVQHPPLPSPLSSSGCHHPTGRHSSIVWSSHDLPDITTPSWDQFLPAHQHKLVTHRCHWVTLDTAHHPELVVSWVFKTKA